MEIRDERAVIYPYRDPVEVKKVVIYTFSHQGKEYHRESCFLWDKPDVMANDSIADALIHKIILDIAEKFGADVALDRLDELEKQIMLLADNPDMGTDPRYMILRRQGYKVL